MSITIILIVIIVLTTMWAWKEPYRQSKLLMNPYQVQTRREYYRFITSGFIHQDSIHLLFNMFTFYFFGSNVERFWVYLYDYQGIIYFLGLFILGIIVSDIPTFLKYKNAPYYNSLGASGGVSAVVFRAYCFPQLPIFVYMVFFVYRALSWGQFI